MLNFALLLLFLGLGLKKIINDPSLCFYYNSMYLINDYFCLSGAASTVINPIVRFVLPDLELGTVMEEESVDVDTDDADDNTDNYAHNIRRGENQCKRFSDYKPSDQYYRKRKTKTKERKCLENDSIRNEVVSDHLLV